MYMIIVNMRFLLSYFIAAAVSQSRAMNIKKKIIYSCTRIIQVLKIYYMDKYLNRIGRYNTLQVYDF